MEYGRISAVGELEIGAGEFKAKCLDILKRLGDRKLSRVVVTRHGKPVAELFPPRDTRADIESLFGCMRGSVRIAEGVDLTAPVINLDDWQPELPE